MVDRDVSGGELKHFSHMQRPHISANFKFIGLSFASMSAEFEALPVWAKRFSRFPVEEPIDSEEDSEESETAMYYYENRKHWINNVFAADIAELRSTNVFVVKSFRAYRSEKLEKNAVVFLSHPELCHIESHKILKFLWTQWKAVANCNLSPLRNNTLVNRV